MAFFFHNRLEGTNDSVQVTFMGFIQAQTASALTWLHWLIQYHTEIKFKKVVALHSHPNMNKPRSFMPTVLKDGFFSTPEHENTLLLKDLDGHSRDPFESRHQTHTALIYWLMLKIRSWMLVLPKQNPQVSVSLQCYATRHPWLCPGLKTTIAYVCLSWDFYRPLSPECQCGKHDFLSFFSPIAWRLGWPPRVHSSKSRCRAWLGLIISMGPTVQARHVATKRKASLGAQSSRIMFGILLTKHKSIKHLLTIRRCSKSGQYSTPSTNLSELLNEKSLGIPIS